MALIAELLLLHTLLLKIINANIIASGRAVANRSAEISLMGASCQMFDVSAHHLRSAAKFYYNWWKL